MFYYLTCPYLYLHYSWQLSDIENWLHFILVYNTNNSFFYPRVNVEINSIPNTYTDQSKNIV